MYRSVCVLVALLSPLVLTLVVPRGQSCPRSCNCYQASEVHCTFRSLLTIPPGLPAYTRRINLGFNSINRIYNNSLAGLKRVELLMLQSNDIHHLPDAGFRDMNSLQILKLSYNKMSEISSSLTFAGLTSLLRLYMDHNHLQHIHPRALLQLPSLRLLRLQGNRLHQLHPHTLCTLSLLNTYYFSTLRHLDLSNNSLTTLSKDTLVKAPLLETLVLHMNPWSCDCRMNWFLTWSLAHPGLMKCSSGPQCPVCASPNSLQGQGLLDQADLPCASPVISYPGRATPLETEITEIQSSEAFREPLGTAFLGLSDQEGNSVDLSCNISDSSDTLPDLSLSTPSPLPLPLSLSLECPVERQSYEKLWRILAYYSETAVQLEREIMLSKTPMLAYRYRQSAETGGYYHTGVKASVKARPQWLLQQAISIQLNRAQSNGHRIHLIYSTRVSAPPGPTSYQSVSPSASHPWVLISTNHTTTALAAFSGSVVELSCPVLSSGSPKVQWILPDESKLISPSNTLDGRLRVSATGLLLKKVQLSDAGLYYCVAQAGRDVDILPVRLAVEESPLPSSGVQVGPPVMGTDGEPVSLTCKLSGSPAPHISWVFPDGKIIEQGLAASGGVTIQSNGSLYMPNPSRRDVGYYRCIAVNQYGSDSLSIQMELKPQHYPLLRTSFPRGPQSAAGRSTKIRAPLFHQIEEGSGDEVDEEERTLVGNTKHPRPLQPPQGRRYPIGKPRRRGSARIRPLSSPDKRRNHFDNRHRATSNKQRIDPQKWADLLAKIRQKTHTNSNSSHSTAGEFTPEPVGRDKDVDTARHEGADGTERGRAEEAGVEAETEGSSTSTKASSREKSNADQISAGGRLSGAPNHSAPPTDWKNPGANSIPDSHSSRLLSPSLSAVPRVPILRARPRIADPHIRTVSFPAESTARLACEAQGEPKPSITWTKVATGAVMSIHSRAQRFEVLPNGTLVIQNVQLQDRGTYICIAQNFLGRDRLITTLDVRTRPPRMQLVSYREATIHQGGELLLECQADAVPSPVLSWVLPDRSVLTSAALSTSRIFMDTNGTLHITATLPSDRGMYRCVASNSAGAASASVRVHVSSLPPMIQQAREEHLLLSPGRSVYAHCSARGAPPPTLRWRIPDGTLVRPSQFLHGNLFVLPNGTLHIQRIGANYSGSYECTASNVVGTDKRTVTVEIDGGAKGRIRDWSARQEESKAVTTEKPSPSYSLNKGRTFESNPFNSTKLSPPTLFDRSSQLALSSSSFPQQPNSSNPLPKINKTASTTHFTKETKASSFSLSSSVPTYNTTVSPSIVDNPNPDKSRASGVLQPLPNSPFTKARIISSSPSITTVQYGGNLQLHCSVVGNPSPIIIWRTPSRKLVDMHFSFDQRLKVHPNGTLSVQVVTEKDAGDYLCITRNKVADDYRLLRVSVVTKPAKIEPKQPLNHMVLLGKPLKVDCQASGLPDPAVHWSLPDGTMVNSVLQEEDRGGRARRLTVFDNGTLLVPAVGMGEEGEYTCFAENQVGQDIMKVKVKVMRTSPPTFADDRRYHVIKVRQGSTATIRCQATGDPAPTVTWFSPAHRVIPQSLNSGFYSERIVVVSGGILKVHLAQKVDTGNYTCQARNSAGETSMVLGLEVEASSHGLSGQAGGRGSPPPRLSWFLPGNGVLPAPYYGSRLTVHRNGSLELRGVRTSDAGTLVCVVRGERGETRIQIELEVSESQEDGKAPHNRKAVERTAPKVLDSFQSLNSQVLLPEVTPPIIRVTQKPLQRPFSLPAAPRPIGPPPHSTGPVSEPAVSSRTAPLVSTINGETLRLPCSVLPTPGYTQGSLLWTLPSGKVLSQGENSDLGKYQVQEDGTLTVQQASVFDRGTYTCRFTSYDSSSVSVITVPVIIIAYPPRITKGPSPVTYTRPGVAVELPCLTIATPQATVTWEAPDLTKLKVMGQARIYGNRYLSPQGSLVIQKPTNRDTGFYRCTAKNVIGVDTKVTYLHVI
ncbi:hypothetical protein Q5P01_013419 [Channa striata]|uniref:Ig-like domain-containing protein n=1 Tax=Channa striata TaxID=64152 RepID=A0AA88MMT5_CHASR|nr:hypothetical protein Q5P01_013419 [Channa striata]